MATTYIPNQPISFINDLDDCAEPSSKYVQIVDTTDKTQFQFKATHCDGNCTNKLNFDDIVYGTGWADGTGTTICKTGIGTGDLEISIGNVSADVTFVRITIVSITGTIEVRIQGNDDAGTVGYITQPGTYEFYSNIGTTNGYLVFHPVTSETEVCIEVSGESNLLVCDVPTGYVIQVRDLNGNYVATETTITWYENYATVTVDWDDLSITSGCYRLCIIDPCLNTNSQLSDFMTTRTDGVPVTSNSTLTLVSTSEINYSSTSNSGTASVVTTYTIPPALNGSCFNLCFTIDSNHAAARVRFVYGASISGWYDGPGNFCIPLQNWNPATSIQFVFQSQYNDEAVHILDLINMTLKVCTEDYTCDCCSTPVKIGTYDCTHLIKSYCDKDALGFKFCNANFVPQIRLYSKLVRASYMTERESFEDSAGNKNTIYYKRRRSKNFRVDPAVAEYVHDYLSTLSGYDHMFIDNREYFVDDDEYQVTYPSRNDIEAIVSFNVSEKVQLVENKNCGTDCVEDYEWQTTAKSCNC